jgi:hypothetical protein
MPGVECTALYGDDMARCFGMPGVECTALYGDDMKIAEEFPPDGDTENESALRSVSLLSLLEEGHQALHLHLRSTTRSVQHR